MKNAALAKIGRNVLAIALFLALFRIAAHTGRLIDVPEIKSALELAAAILAVWLAFRLSAVGGVVFAGTMAVFLGVESLYHAIFGYLNVQGGPVHLAVMTASLAGLLLGVFTAPRLAVLRARTEGTSERMVPEQQPDRREAQRSSLSAADLHAY